MTRFRFTGAVALAGGIIASGTTLLAQSPKNVHDSEYVSQSIVAVSNLSKDKYYLGGDNCLDCHKIGHHPRICRTETLYWMNDHHKDAFDSLVDSDRGRQISALYKVNGTKKVDVTKPEAGCIQCHSVPITDDKSTTTWSHNGVYCEACHGPSSQWQTKHNVYETWTKPLKDPALAKKREEEKTSFGWIDIHSPVTRAELCLSCHVGSKQQNRVITHDMYAAGHPPLTGYELETSADKMPRHWRYAREKSLDGAQFERTRNMLVAAVVTMRMSVELTVDDAKSNRWPELARLDCFACHHELQAPGVRPVDPSIPGRPPIIVGCLPLVNVAGSIGNGSPNKELDDMVNELKGSFRNNPFGEPAEIVPRCKAIIDWCRNVENRLAATELTSKQARDVLRELASTAGKENRDYDESRQIMDAWMVCYRELTADDNSGLAADKRALIEQSFDKINERWKHFVELKPLEFDCKNPPEKRPYKETLDDQFKNRIDFDQQKFSSFMTKLSKQVPE